MLIQRYILAGLVRNFLLILLAITGIVFLVLMGKSVGRYQEMSLQLVLSRIHHLVPFAMKFSLPLSLLVGTLLVYGRLSADNEFLALRFGGLHPFHAITPALVLGACLAGVCVFVNGTLDPGGQVQIRSVTKDDLRIFLDNLREQRLKRFASKHVDMAWDSVDEEGWLQNFRFDLSPRSETPVQGEANRARISRDTAGEELTFELREVTIARGDMRDRISADYQIITYPISLLFDAPTHREHRQYLTNQQISYRLHRDPLLGHPSDGKRLRQFRMEYWGRIWLAFSCLIFVLVGAPLGIIFKRGSFMACAVVALLLAFVIYYPLYQAGQSLAEQGRLPAMLAMAIPDLVLGGVGLLLLARVVTR